jgi:hypothetical protein
LSGSVWEYICVAVEQTYSLNLFLLCPKLKMGG